MIFLQIPDQIKGFSRTEYLSVFLGFLYAAVATEFLANWAKFFRHRLNVINNLEQVLWSFLLFSFLLINWFGAWTRMEFVANSFKDFVFTLVPVMLYYFMVVLVFPEKDNATSQKSLFEKNMPVILLFLCGYTFLQLGYDIAVAKQSLFTVSNLLRSAVVVAGIVAFIKNTAVARWALFAAGTVVMLKAAIELQ